MSAPLLQVENLRITVPARSEPVVAGLDFDLAAGECLALIGASGSGKSLTSAALIGLLPAAARAEGSIRFAGEELMAAAPETWRRVRGAGIGMVWQDAQASLHPLRRIGAQLAEALHAAGIAGRAAARERAAALLAEVGAVLDAELIPELDAVAPPQVDVGATLVLAHDPGGDRGAIQLGDDVLRRLLQLVVHLLAVARLPELAAAAADRLPLGEGPVGPSLILLAAEQAAVDAVEQVELHAEVADGILVPAGQLVALGLEGEIVDAAEHQILAIGAQAQGLDLLEGAAIPLLQVERVDAQVLVQPLAGEHPLGRPGQGLEQVAGEIRRHVVEGAGAGLIRVAQP